MNMFLDDLMGKYIYKKKYVMDTLSLFVILYVLVDAVILIWFFTAPYLARNSDPILFGISMAAYNFGYLVSNCHQMPHRTIILNDIQFPFCARDTGIYIGCLIGGLLPFIPFKTPKILQSFYTLPIYILPIAVDGVTQTILKLRESDNNLRLITGLFFGFGIAYVFIKKIVVNSGDLMNKNIKPAVILTLLFTLSIFTLGISVSEDYITYSQASADLGYTPSLTTYIPGRAFQTIRSDPYKTFDEDAVIYSMKQYGYHRHGAWVFVKGEITKTENTVYTSRNSVTVEIKSDKKN